MTKRLSAKVGSFVNQQGETKGEYVKIGVVMDGQNGEFMLLDPSVNLAGVLLKQNALAASEGKQARDSVMVSVFEQDNQNNQPQQNNYQQNAPQQNQQGSFQPQQNAPQQGGFQPQQNGYQQNNGQ